MCAGNRVFWKRLALITLMSGLFFVGCSETQVEPPAPSTIPEPVALALTPMEYNNTVRDLLGMPLEAVFWPEAPTLGMRGVGLEELGKSFENKLSWPWKFPAEIGVDAFDGMNLGQIPSPYMLEQLQRAAIHFAPYVLVSPIFFFCEDWANLASEERTNCAWTSLERFAQRAFRRPIQTEELERLKTLWLAHLSEEGLEEAIVLTVAGILQTPQFLYRIEYGTQEGLFDSVRALNDWEIASRLSYFLWDSLPDPLLFHAAHDGLLSTRENLEAQARRMLQDPRARSTVVDFHQQWLGTRYIHRISPARRVYAERFGISAEALFDLSDDYDWPSVLINVRKSMELETRLFVEHVVFDAEGSLESLLTDNRGFVSDATHALYGDKAIILEGAPVIWRGGDASGSYGQNHTLALYPAEFPSDERAGLLTLPSVLALYAHPVHPAPILRGVFILERLACQNMGTPPSDAECQAPPDSLSAESTNRERVEAVTAPAQCATCHTSINPPGFAFEHYDSLGAWRSLDNGQPVDASGSLTLSGGEALQFKSPVELVHQLAQSTQVRDCYALRWARYATGVQLSPEHPAVTELQERFRNNDSIQDLLVSIIVSDIFRYRPLEVSP